MMVSNIPRISMLLAAFLALAACSGGNGPQTQSQTSMFADLRAAVRANQADPSPTPVITRALLDRLTAPSLEVVSEKRGLTAYLVPLAFRADAGPGRVTVWRTASGEQVALRNGVITATRGIGNDLASANVASSVRAVRSGGPGGQRVLYLRTDDGDQRAMPMSCRARDIGPQTITIVERTFATRHVRETCGYNGATAINDYWVDRADGTVWQSRQWLGPDIGYLRLRLLRR